MKMNKIKIFWLSVLALAGLTTPAQAYTVTVAEAQNCSVSLSPEKDSYDEGDEITVTITPNAGATFDSFELYYECTEAEWWEANSSMVKPQTLKAPRRRASSLSYRLESFYFNDDYDDEYEEVAEGEEYTFTMPARNVEIEAIYTADDTAYAITTTQKDNGTTSVSASTATAGATVTITATPASGYVVDEVKAYEKVASGSMVFEDELTCTEVTATTFTFTMPANPVRVEVTYKQPTLYEKGDVNKDGKISLADVTALVNILTERVTDYDSDVANVDGADGIDENDLTRLVEIILTQESNAVKSYRDKADAN